MSTAFHPQTDGQVEKMNDVIESALRHYVLDAADRWDTLLSGIEFALNNALCSATSMSPIYFNYGFDPRMPTDVLYTNGKVPNAQQVVNELKRRGQRAREYIAVAQNRYRDPNFTVPEYKVGDWVGLSTRNFRSDLPGGKHLAPRYVGPYCITDRRGKLAYTLDIPATRKHRTFHYDLLQLFVGTPPAKAMPIPCVENLSGDDVYAIERILAHRPRGSSVQYLVRWAGYTSEHDQWVSKSNVTRAAIGEYERSTEYADCQRAIDERRAAKTAPTAADETLPPRPPARRSARLRQRAASVNVVTMTYDDIALRPSVHCLAMQAMADRYYDWTYFQHRLPPRPAL